MNKVVKELNDLQEEVLKIRNDLQTISTKIMKPKNEQPSRDTDFKAKLSEILLGLKDINEEQQKLQAEIRNLDNNRLSTAASFVTHKLQHLGCSMIPVTKADRNYMSFDFGKGYSIAVQLDDSKMSLVRITPQNENFPNIKRHFDKDQDLMGLLIFYSSMVKSKHNSR